MQEAMGGGQAEGGGQVQKGDEVGRDRDDRGDTSVFQKLGRHTDAPRSWVILRSATATGAAAEWRERRDWRRMARQRRV